MTQRKTARRRTAPAPAPMSDQGDVFEALASFAARAFPGSDAAVLAALALLRDLGDCSLVVLARASVDGAPGEVVRWLGPGEDAAAVARGTAFLRQHAARLATMMTPTTMGKAPGAVLVVPLCTSDGLLWGWLMAFDPTALHVAPDTLSVLAALLMRHIERATPTVAARGDLATSAPGHDRTAEPVGIRLERDAEAQAQELEAIVGAMSDGVFVYDQVGHLVRVNPAGRALLGVAEPRSTSLDGEMDARAIRWGLRDADGHPMPPEAWPLARVLRGEQFSGESSVDVLMHTAHGQERLISFSGAPIRLDDGTLIGAVTLAYDVTARRRLERRTQVALEALLGMATALVGTSDGTSHERRDLHRVVDLTQRVLAGQYTSIARVEMATGTIIPEAMVGLVGEVAERWWHNVATMDIHAYFTDEIVAQLAAGDVLQLDLSGTPPVRGQDYFGQQMVLVAAAPLANADLCILTVESREQTPFGAADISMARAAVQLAALVIERERLMRERTDAQARELALQTTNAQMLTFLGIAGHELRTPVTGLKVSAQLAARSVAVAMQDDLPPAATKSLARAQGLLTTADRQVGKLNALIGDLLDVTRIQAGKLDLRLALVDVAAIARATIEDQQLAWPDRPIHLDAPAHPVEVQCDADRVDQVITNFLTNALKYSSDEESVTVLVQPLADGVRVAVTDHGPGIAPAAQGRLWELFHQVPGIQQMSGSGVGLGIGLYLCRTIIERHGGQVGVDSMAGQGSTFWFTLPHSPAAA